MCHSPIGAIFALNGDPARCLSPSLMLMMYSPDAVGTYDTLQVPSSFSMHWISAFDGPSTARAKPSGQI